MRKLASTFYQVIKTGKLYGYSVSRNPLTWLPATLVAVIMIPVVIIVLPIAIIANVVGLVMSRPYKSRDNQADFLNILKECEQVHMSESDINFHHWREMAQTGNFVAAAQGFIAEAKLKKQGMPHGYWVYLHRLSKLSK